MITHQFSILCHVLDRIAFPNGVIAVDVVEDTAVEEEIPTIDPTLASLRLFVEGGNAAIVKGNATKTRWRAYGRDRRQLAVGVMERHQSREIDISNTIAIGEHEGLVVREPSLHTFQTSPCLGVQSRVNQVHGPWELIVPMHDSFPRSEVNGEIIIDGIKVQKILFNDFCFISQRNDEFIDALRGIDV